MMTHFENLLNSTGITGIKNIDSIYEGVNTFTAELLGFKNPDHCIGKTDFDLPCRASSFASHYIAQDRQVFLTKKTLITLDIQNYATGWKTLISTRSLIPNDRNKNPHLIIHCNDVSNTVLSKYYLNLFQLDSLNFGTEYPQSATYILNAEHCPFQLTERQETCLFLLVRGKSLKEIARALQISPRTVEDHLELIKDKLGCETKRDLVEKAIDCGFLYYLPHSKNK